MRHRRTGTGKEPQEGDTKGWKAEALLKPTLPKTPAPARGGAGVSSPSLAAPSPPTPAAASGSCMGYSPGRRSWVQQPLEGEGEHGTITRTCSRLTSPMPRAVSGSGRQEPPRCLEPQPCLLTRDQHAGDAPAVPHPQHILVGAELEAVHMAREPVCEVGLLQGRRAGLALSCPYVDHVAHSRRQHSPLGEGQVPRSLGQGPSAQRLECPSQVEELQLVVQARGGHVPGCESGELITA